jgi:3-hexulose-6-phosphate synthase
MNETPHEGPEMNTRKTIMKLQLALDLVDIIKAKVILDEVHDLIDIVEIGTPLIIREGVKAIAEIKQAYPSLEVLADVKIMDGGDYEAKLAYEAGADIVTVLGAAMDATIQKATRTAREYQKQVMVDMIAVENLEQRALQVDNIGVDYICVHTASDVQDQGENPLEELRRLHHILRKSKAAVAGGISAETLPHILPYQPEIVIVGSAITTKHDKRKAALEIREAMG